MVRNVSTVLALSILLLFASPTPSRADFLQTVGDGLKTVGEGAVNLFKKGKDKVVSLFGGGADPQKVPYFLRKIEETQGNIQEKQRLLLSVFGKESSIGSSASKSKPISDAFIKERVKDLQAAYEDNQKYRQKLQTLLEKCSKKGKDVSQYKEAIEESEKTQAAIDKDMKVLNERLAKYMPSSQGGSEGKNDENPSGLSKEDLAARFNDSKNPYASAGLGKKGSDANVASAGEGRPGSAGTDADSPSYEPGLSGQKSSTSAGQRLDPHSAEVKKLIDQWLASKGLDPYGRLLSKNITASGPADTGGLSREAWLLGMFPELRKFVKARLQGKSAPVESISKSPSTESSDRPKDLATAPSTSTAGTASSSLASKEESHANSQAKLQDALSSGEASPEDMKRMYEKYRQEDESRRDDIAQQHQAATSY